MEVAERSVSSASADSIPAQSSAMPPASAAEPVPPDVNDDWEAPLKENQRKEVTSELLDPIEITFSEVAELVRERNKLLPSRSWRTFYETSATLSRFVTIDTHVKHRKKPNLKIKEGNAFQTVAEFSVAKYLTKESIELHLVWNQKKNPSAYISTFNALGPAMRRAGFHYKDSQRIGQRVSVAEIDMAGLIPATVRAICKSTVKLITKHGYLGETEKSKKVYRDVEIPVWIRKTAKDRFGSTITPEQLTQSGADMWVSITEIRKSNLKNGPDRSIKRDIICAKGHDYEWLCCGSISELFITRVMPYDGKRLFETDPGYPIRSFENSGHPWVYNWAQNMWLPDRLTHDFMSLNAPDTNNKRKLGTDEEVSDGNALPQLRSRQPQVLAFSLISTNIDIPTG